MEFLRERIRWKDQRKKESWVTTRERFLKCLKFEPVDRPPNFELGYWGQTLERWLAEGMPPEAVQDSFYGHAFFGIDRRDFLPLNFGLVPPFQEEILEETDRHVLFRNGDGVLHKAMKTGTVRGTRPSMDQYLDFPVKTREDWEKLKKRLDPTSPDRYPANWSEAVARFRGEREAPLCLVPNAAFGFYSHPRRWMGTENLSLAFYDDPAMMHDMMDFLADLFIETVKPALNAVQVDYVNFFEDFAYKTGPLISPHLFQEFLLPRYQRVIGFLRSFGIEHFWFDTDGNPEVLIPLLLEAGITCLWPLEAAAGMDPRKIRREYGRDLALSGGIDKREIAKDRAAIDREVMGKIPDLVADGGYLPTLDHTFPPDISYDNFQYYLEVKQRAMEG